MKKSHRGVSHLFVSGIVGSLVFSSAAPAYSQETPSTEAQPGHETKVARRTLYELRQVLRSSQVAEEVEFAIQELDEIAASGNAAAASALGDYYVKFGGDSKKAKLASEHYERALLLGDKSAAAKLGNLHRRGPQNGLNPSLAEGFYREGVALGDPKAMIGLADLYKERADLLTNIDVTLELLTRALSLGERTAATRLGALYSLGSAVKLDPHRAAFYFQQGIDAGDPWALVGMADLYAAGNAVALDSEKAVTLYEQAVAKGNARAAVKLGNYFSSLAAETGNWGKAIAYLQKAADLNDPSGLAALAEIYRKGNGVPKNIARAIELHKAAFDRGVISSATKLGDIYLEDQHDQTTALKYYDDAISAGDAYALIRAGEFYENQADAAGLAKAAQLYERARIKGYAKSYAKLGALFTSGKDAALDPMKGLMFYQQGADAGDVSSILALAYLYRDGNLVAANIGKSADYFEQAYKAGNEIALSRAAHVLIRGSSADQIRGRKLLDLGIEMNVPGVVPVLADAYIYGLAFPVDTQKGINLLKQASAKNDLSASLRLIQIYVQGAKGIRRSPDMAESLYKKIESELSDIQRLIEKLYIDSASNSGDSFFEDLDVVWQEQDTLVKSQIAGRLAGSNLNAYVYIMQRYMKDQGKYMGPLNGMLTASTIKAFNSMCAASEKSNECAAGPLSPRARRVFQLMLKEEKT
jgi:TPR repeat protein